MPNTPYSLSGDDDPSFDSLNPNPGQPLGWTGIATDPNAPAGGNGPGFHAGYPLRTPYRETFGSEHLRVLVADAQVASRARDSFSSPAVVDSLQHAAAWVGNSVLGQVALQLGVSVGLAESLWDQLKGLYLLPRTFVLAAQYEIALEASHYHLPSWAVRGTISAVEASFGLAAFTLGATLPEEKKAYDEVQALIRETKSLMEGGSGKAWEQLKKFGGKKWQQAQADWDKYLSLLNSGHPSKMYEAGVMFGRFEGELLTTILLLISVAGAAVRIARLAASGVGALVELAGLVTEAEGTEIGAAAKTLLSANAELQSARAAGNVQRIAEGEKNVAAAAKDLQQKAEAAQQALEQNAPNLVKESGKIKDAKAKAEGAGGGDASKPEPEAKGPSVEQSPKGVPRTETRNGYQYTFDEQNRVTRVEGDLTSNAGQGRNPKAQLQAGGSDRLPTDEGGHFVGRRFDGPIDDFNHFAQDTNFNRSAYKKLENSWQRALDNGSDLHVEITPNYPGASLRPESLDVDYTIDGVPYRETFINQPGG